MRSRTTAFGTLTLALLLAPRAASADLPFGSGFEGGRLCDWADGEGACSSEEEMASDLVGTYPVCVPPTATAIPGGSLTLCSGSLCASGEAGCDATARVTSSTFSLALSTATFNATLDDDVFPTQVTLGATYACDLAVTQGTGTGALSFTMVPACFVPLVEIATVDLQAIDLDVTLAFSGCAVAPILNSFLPSLAPAGIAQAEQQVGALLEAGARRAWLGRWVCPGP